MPAAAYAEPMQVFGSIRSRPVRSRSGGAELWLADRKLGTLHRDCFGEIDPGSSQPQRVSVVASPPMRLLSFSSYGIDRLRAAIPEARERILASRPDKGERPVDSSTIIFEHGGD
ncbi:MAG TPA: hypothetical protein VG365_11765 [Solirubrobacteraceae bacterium]|nr:hypothetical protein [Solirubrobacteraceae bacterium]